MTVGNGKLRFTAQYKQDKYSFDVYLRDVLPLNQYKGSVEFGMQTGGKRVQQTFWVQLPGKGKAAAAANIQAAKELYEALKAGSK